MTTKSYFLVRNFDCPPDGVIQIGHILSDASDPLSSLNADDHLPLPPSIVKTSFKTGFTATRAQVRDGKFGIWAQILEGASFGTSVNFLSSKNDIYTVQTMDTSFMWLALEAAKSCVQKSVELKGVKRYLEASRYRKSVYMITGVKVARGASVNCDNTMKKGGVAKAIVDLTPMGIPVKAGPEAEISSKKVDNTAFEGGEDFVFAYQLRKITCSKKKPLKDEAFTRGSMFETGSSGSTVGVQLEVFMADTDMAGIELGAAEVIHIHDEIEGDDFCAILKGAN